MGSLLVAIRPVLIHILELPVEARYTVFENADQVVKFCRDNAQFVSQAQV